MLTDAELLKLVDHYYGGPDLVRAATHYLGLHVGETPPNFATGADAVEPVGNGYARVAVNEAFWEPAGVAASGAHAGKVVKANAVEALFPEATGSWGTPTYGLVFAAGSGGTPVGIALISSGANPIGAGTQVRFGPGRLLLVARRAA